MKVLETSLEDQSMAMNIQELQNLLLQEWEDSFSRMDKQEVIRYRAIRIRAFDGADMEPIYKWPVDTWNMEHGS